MERLAVGRTVFPYHPVHGDTAEHAQGMCLHQAFIVPVPRRRDPVLYGRHKVTEKPCLRHLQARIEI
jgi:hypothetical protein